MDTKENNVNNYEFSRHMDQFKLRMLDPQEKKVVDAQKIMDDINYQWREGQRTIADLRLKNFKEQLSFFREFYSQGLKLCSQHERLVDKMSKVYDKWYNDISNEGRQEVELMSSQADMLNEIFSEIYKELLPLNLDGMKPPQAMNL